MRYRQAQLRSHLSLALLGWDWTFQSSVQKFHESKIYIFYPHDWGGNCLFPASCPELYAKQIWKGQKNKRCVDWCSFAPTHTHSHLQIAFTGRENFFEGQKRKMSIKFDSPVRDLIEIILIDLLAKSLINFYKTFQGRKSMKLLMTWYMNGDVKNWGVSRGSKELRSKKISNGII